MKLFIVLCLVAVVAGDFSKFKTKFGRKFKTPKEAQDAEGHYKRHLKFNTEHNAKFAAGKVTFKVGENEFMDQNNTELAAKYNTPIDNDKNMRALPKQQNTGDPTSYPPGPDSVSYMEFMQDITNQGSLNVCWAFATIAQVESLYMRNGYDYKLSEQHIIDCQAEPGMPSRSMDFILTNGSVLRTNYPYAKPRGYYPCMDPLPALVAPAVPVQNNFFNLAGNETLYKNIIASEGPVVAVVSVNSLFYKYESGVFFDTECPTGSCGGNHAVLVIGYGTDPLLGDYWLVRNSWGPNWGENGYIRMARNKNSNCAIACRAWFLT